MVPSISAAAASQPRAKFVWYFGEPVWHEGSTRTSLPDLKALTGEAPDGSLEGRPGNQGKPTYWIAESAGVTRRAREAAIRLMVTRRRSQSPMPPPAV